MIRIYNDVTVEYQNETDYLQSNVVYLITFPDGKYYVGSTTEQLNIRISHHCSKAITLNKQLLVSFPIREFMKFDVKILGTRKIKRELRDLESNYTNEYKSDEREFGYNNDSGDNVSEETKLKMSEAHSHHFFDDFNNQFRSPNHASEYYNCGSNAIRNLLKSGKKSKKLGTGFHYV